MQNTLKIYVYVLFALIACRTPQINTQLTNLSNCLKETHFNTPALSQETPSNLSNRFLAKEEFDKCIF